MPLIFIVKEMASIIPIAYFTGTTVAGTTKQGNLIIGDTSQDYGAFPGGYRFWATTDLDAGYCIATEVPSGNQPNPLSIPCYVGFYSTEPSLDDESFLSLANYVTNNSQGFVDPTTAANYLNSNGYWTNYGAGRYRILSWDIQNPTSYPGTGTTIVDLLGRSNGTLVGTIPYTSGTPDYLSVTGSSSQYIINSQGLGEYFPDTEITTLLWIYPQANGVILSELGQSQVNNGWHDAQIQMVGGTLKFGVWPYDNTGSPSITSSIATPFNNWYHVGFSYNGTVLTAYVNGQSAGTITITRSAPPDLYYGIGSPDYTSLAGVNQGPAGTFRFGSLEVYNYGLSGAQVQSKFNATKGSYGL